MQNESEAGNATRKSQKQRLTKKKIKTSRRLVGTTPNAPKNSDKVCFGYLHPLPLLCQCSITAANVRIL